MIVMAAPTSTIWTMKPHTEAKHRIWRIHLDGWLPTITGGFEERVLVIDGFCGPGEYIGGADGSPIIALKALLDHKFMKVRESKEFVFVFLDEDKARVDHLEKIAIPQRIGDLPANVKVHCERGGFEPVVTKILDDLDANQKRLAPSIVLVDPFGWSGIPMTLMHRILAQPKAELLITFMLESVNRFLTHPDPKIRAHLDELFGTDAWRAIPDDPDRYNRLRELYERQLRKGAEFVRGFQMYGPNGKPVYDLVFAGNHIQGMRKIKGAMWKVDPARGGSFSDRAFAQPSLFEIEPGVVELDLAPMDDQLVARFAGQTATIGQVENFVVAETDFRETHVRSRLKVLEDAGRIVVVERMGKKRRGKSYPAGTEIKFL